MKKIIIGLLFFFTLFFTACCYKWQSVLFIRVEDKYFYTVDYYSPYYCHPYYALCDYIKVRFDGDYLVFKYKDISGSNIYEYRINVNTTDYTYGR